MKTLAEKIEVMQACLEGKEIELMPPGDVTWITYDQDGDPEFNWHINDYRVKEVPLTKPSINWDHVHPDFKWMATDKCGETYLFVSEPTIDISLWDGPQWVCASNWTSFVPGTCDWKDSLVERPTK